MKQRKYNRRYRNFEFEVGDIGRVYCNGNFFFSSIGRCIYCSPGYSPFDSVDNLVFLVSLIRKLMDNGVLRGVLLVTLLEYTDYSVTASSICDWMSGSSRIKIECYDGWSCLRLE